MSKMAEIAYEVEEMLCGGHSSAAIAKSLNVPIEWVLNIEEDLMQLADPRSYGPDYA